jgi:hypothetical protein
VAFGNNGGNESQRMQSVACRPHFVGRQTCSAEEVRYLFPLPTFTHTKITHLFLKLVGKIGALAQLFYTNRPRPYLLKKCAWPVIAQKTFYLIQTHTNQFVSVPSS